MAPVADFVSYKYSLIKQQNFEYPLMLNNVQQQDALSECIYIY